MWYGDWVKYNCSVHSVSSISLAITVGQELCTFIKDYTPQG